jgi:hypothetical protein
VISSRYRSVKLTIMMTGTGTPFSNVGATAGSPWKAALVGVLAHPFFHVTAADGSFTLQGPPKHNTPGQRARLRGGRRGNEQRADQERALHCDSVTGA